MTFYFSYIKRLFFLLFFLLYLSFPNQIYAHLFEQIPVTKNIGNMNLNSICQDRRGTIWIASISGLYYYNGFRLVAYTAAIGGEPVLFQNIRSIVCDKENNRLYFLHDNCLASLDLSTDVYTKYDNFYNFNSVAKGNERILLSSKNTIYQLDTKTNRIEYYMSIEGAGLIQSLFEYDNYIYVGTSNTGVYEINMTDKKVQRILSEREITNFCLDEDANLWVCSDGDGLFKISPEKNISHYTSQPDSPIRLSSNNIRNVCMDNTHIYIATNDGINCYNRQTHEIFYYGSSVDRSSGFSGSSVWSMILDNKGTVWLATFSGDIYLFNPRNDMYHSIITEEQTSGRNPMLGLIVKDKHDKLWIASEWNGLFSYSLSNHKVQQYRYSLQKKGSDNISALYYDEKDDRIWTGSSFGGLCEVDPQTGNITKIAFRDYPQLVKKTVKNIQRVGDRLFFLTQEGMFVYSLTDKSTVLLDTKLRKIFSQFYVQHDSALWLTDYNNLMRYNLKTREIKNYPLRNKNRNNIYYHTTVSQIYYDEQLRKIWMPSRGWGLFCFDLQTEEMEHFSTHNSDLLSNLLYQITPLSAGIYMISTNNGLSLFDYTNRHFLSYTKEKGFPLSLMVPGAFWKDNQRDLYLSGKEGLFCVDKSRLFPEESSFDVWFSELWVNYKRILPLDDSKLLKKSLSETSEIELNYRENILSIYFSTNNYIKNNDIIYEYLLDGFDSDWKQLHDKNQIDYMNLSAGSYRLRLRAYSQTSPQNRKEISLVVHVHPHPLLSWWAILLYIGILFLSILGVRKTAQTRMRMKNSIYLANREKKQLEQANQSKLRFFTNIAHEFKTPITLIIGQLQLMIESNVIPSVLVRQVYSIYKQALQLQELVVELIDFRKQEQGYLVLNYSEENLGSFLEEIYASFKEQAKLKKIQLFFDDLTQNKRVWFDAAQLKKVVNNILLNALKYTNDEGRITLRSALEDTCFTIEVEDNGIGIPQDQSEKLFDRFYRVERLSEPTGTFESSGIGLAFSKSIVESHGGRISIQSEVGAGSKVIIRIPFDFSELERSGKVKRILKQDDDNRCISCLNIKDDSAHNDFRRFVDGLDFKLTVLIVEDNEELRNMLQHIFANFSQAVTAADGEEGWTKLIAYHPDIVISDLLMPVLSGIDLCKRIKNSSEWCHTPIIMLTGCSSFEQNIEGLKAGADDYITKPFNIDILLTRCMNILLNRQLLRQKFSREIDAQPVTVTSNISDQNFIERAFHIIESKIDDPTLSIPYIAKEMLVSQSTFTNKIKALTGQTPLDFVVGVKLRKGAELLLKMPNEKIVVIANMVGFANPKYFAACFKEHFGFTPSDYRKKKFNSEEELVSESSE